jgi:hypothetical protein
VDDNYGRRIVLQEKYNKKTWKPGSVMLPYREI